MNELAAFLARVAPLATSSVERAIACLWWAGRNDAATGMTPSEICRAIEAAGHAQQNSSRLDDQLADDRRTTRVRGTKAWRLIASARDALDAKYSAYAEAEKKLLPSDSVLPRQLFEDTRGYIENVVRQINGSYDHTLYDCCAVMCRRLLETLIIEVYEHVGRPTAVKGKDGHFFMFAELLRTMLADNAFNLSRNAKKGLEDFKQLGDLSAHSRRYNANRNDIDRVRNGMRIAAEELLHLAGLT